MIIILMAHLCMCTCMCICVRIYMPCACVYTCIVLIMDIVPHLHGFMIDQLHLRRSCFGSYFTYIRNRSFFKVVRVCCVCVYMCTCVYALPYLYKLLRHVHFDDVTNSAFNLWWRLSAHQVVTDFLHVHYHTCGCTHDMPIIVSCATSL